MNIQHLLIHICSLGWILFSPLIRNRVKTKIQGRFWCLWCVGTPLSCPFCLRGLQQTLCHESLIHVFCPWPTPTNTEKHLHQKVQTITLIPQFVKLMAIREIAFKGNLQHNNYYSVPVSIGHSVNLRVPHNAGTSFMPGTEFGQPVPRTVCQCSRDCQDTYLCSSISSMYQGHVSPLPGILKQR